MNLETIEYKFNKEFSESIVNLVNYSLDNSKKQINLCFETLNRAV
jgi:hypothetical protein